jgi:hypothetical protein
MRVLRAIGAPYAPDSLNVLVRYIKKMVNEKFSQIEICREKEREECFFSMQKYSNLTAFSYCPLY